jgi:hypothetical protein
MNGISALGTESLVLMAMNGTSVNRRAHPRSLPC